MSVELLAPVGSMESFKAAIQNYADAVYLAGKAFGARAYANNFSNDEIKEMINYAHLFGVKVYITINTIIFDSEFPELISFLDFLYENDCDGIIVQDLGVANLITQRYPGLDLHASTQMNIHSLQQVKTLKELGFKRVVLARELSIEEIKKIKKNVDIEIEVFVHGALCVSYSGNCYFSSIVGKRSGNRGRCAQPCRMEYTLNGKTGYLISPKDLNTIEYINQLIEAKIDSLKIEGRMRRSEYVGQVVKSYKEAINNYYQNNKFNLENSIVELKKIYNRSFTKGFIFDETNNEYTNINYSNHIGIEIGEVVSSNKDWIQIKLTNKLSKGDSIRLVGQVTDAITINQMYKGKALISEASNGDIIRVKPHKENLLGARVFLTTSSQQISSIQKTYDKEYRTILIDGRCYLDNDYLCLYVTNGDKEVVVRAKVEDALKLNSNDRIFEQLQKTLNTVFRFRNLEILIDKPIYISVKDINELRRQALSLLIEKIQKIYKDRNIQEFSFHKTKLIEEQNQINIKVRNVEQLKVVVNYPVSNIYVTDKELLEYQEIYPDIKFFYVVPRINKNNYSHLSLLTSDISLIENSNSSVYLNIANNYAVNLLEKMQVNRIGLSLELSFSQIKDLVRNYQKINQRNPNFEVMVYGRYELMMMKYCPIDKVNDGDERKKNILKEFHLIDRMGFNFPIIRDKDCTIKILNSKKLHLIDYLEELNLCGIKNILLDFTNENSEEVGNVCEMYFNNKKEMRLEEVTYGHFKEGVL